MGVNNNDIQPDNYSKCIYCGGKVLSTNICFIETLNCGICSVCISHISIKDTFRMARLSIKLQNKLVKELILNLK